MTLNDIRYDILQENNERVVDEIRAKGGCAFGYCTDITSEESIAEISKQIKWDLGDVDILISKFARLCLKHGRHAMGSAFPCSWGMGTSTLRLRIRFFMDQLICWSCLM